jgi:hypothetical protein
MAGFLSPFSGSDDDDLFDATEEYAPAHLPDPGPFLDEGTVLTGDDHVAFHRLTRDLFEERGVYDATFGYNLARLNLDRRHPDAGFRYAAVESGHGRVLRAEFTPTTPFCPQSRALTVGAFRAWNGLAERHDYDLVRVRLHPMHNSSDSVNEELDRLAEAFRETGEVRRDTDADPAAPGEADETDVPF